MIIEYVFGFRIVVHVGSAVRCKREFAHRVHIYYQYGTRSPKAILAML